MTDAEKIAILTEALLLIAAQCEEHPAYMFAATEREIETEGGDAATITYWAQAARRALKDTK